MSLEVNFYVGVWATTGSQIGPMDPKVLNFEVFMGPKILEIICMRVGTYCCVVS